jgi:hypothetical protein
LGTLAFSGGQMRRCHAEKRVMKNRMVRFMCSAGPIFAGLAMTLSPACASEDLDALVAGAPPPVPSGDSAGSAPGVTEAAPNASDTAPDASDTAPDASDTAPNASDVAPDTSDTAADASDTAALPNMVPATYSGTPFNALTIPGTIYLADYDKGGVGVAYCSNNMETGSACAGGLMLTDWCCGNDKSCDERAQPTVCPVYRADDDNAGLSHMNLGEPDLYAATQPSWVPGPNGPTLTGPMVTAGTPVPQDANATMERDVYLSHVDATQWVKYTVNVEEPGAYSIGGFMGAPAGASAALDFGNGIGTGTFPLPVSPCPSAGCSMYHSWSAAGHIAEVNFPSAGTYLMTLTVETFRFNLQYLTFTKM